MQPHTLLHKKCWINLQWLTDFFDAASRRRSDVILLPAISRVSGNDSICSSRTVHRNTAPRTRNSWTAASRNAKLSGVQCVLRNLGSHVASCPPQINPVWMNWNGGSTNWCGLEQSIFDETIDQWRRRHRACVHAKGGHFQYSFLWSDNVDFIHICYIQCVLCDCYIFNYEIVPATLANTHTQLYSPIHSCSFYKVVH